MRKKRKNHMMHGLELVGSGARSLPKGVWTKRGEKERREAKGKEQRREKRERIWKEWERWIFLVLVVAQNSGVADATDDTQNGGRKMEEIRWKKEIARNSWAKQEDQRHLQEQRRGRSRNEMQKPSKAVKVPAAEWLGMEHGEEVREKVQSYLRHLLRN